MDIESRCVVVAMVTSKSTKCSSGSVRVSFAVLYFDHYMKKKTNPLDFSNSLHDLMLKGPTFIHVTLY